MYLMMAQQKKLPDMPQLIEPQAGGDDEGDAAPMPADEMIPSNIPVMPPAAPVGLKP
jgi:hypothetical protein